jgi:hypothetical protein
MPARLFPVPPPHEAADDVVEESTELFDRVDAYAEQADFEPALESLAAAERLCGGLTPGYLAKRARWKAILEAEALALTRRSRWSAG